MFHIILFEPEIPPNTGNIIRLCANTGCVLHLIEPLGFVIDDKRMRRAGLDYGEWADVKRYHSLQHFHDTMHLKRIFACTTKAKQSHTAIDYEKDDGFLFGPETRGLPETLLHEMGTDQCIRIPMLPHSRSLNLSNSVSVIIYEAWRQLGFSGAK